MTSLGDARTLVQKFRSRDARASDPKNGTSPNGWAVTRSVLADDLDSRLGGKLGFEPYPYQGQTNYCGEAAFLYCLLKDRPDLYVKYAIGLWEEGKFNFKNGDGRDFWVEPGPKTIGVFNTLPASSAINRLDWMMMASLSKPDRGNAALDDQVSAITTPGDMEKWFKAVGSRELKTTLSATYLGHLTSGSLGDFTSLFIFPQLNWIVLEIQPEIIKNQKSVRFARHWIVVGDWPSVSVNSPFGQQSSRPLHVADKKFLNEQNAGAAKLSMSFVTWGSENAYNLRDGITVAQFIDDFYGGAVFTSIP